MDMEPRILFALAEAAEKYQVFGAMNTCITRFQYACPFINNRKVDLIVEHFKAN